MTPYRDLFCGGKGHQDHHRGPTPREIQYDSFDMVVALEEVDMVRDLPQLLLELGYSLLILLLLNTGSSLLFMFEGIFLYFSFLMKFHKKTENETRKIIEKQRLCD